MKNSDLPLLHDHHTHPLLYAALRQAVDLSDVTELQQACDLVNERRDTRGVVVAHSWKSNFFEFPHDVLESLPACAILNHSLHSLAINAAGKTALSDLPGIDVDRVGDPIWFEHNLRPVLNWLAKLGGSEQSLVEFFEYLESLGVYSAEEMLLVDGCEIDWFEATGLIDRTCFWAAPDTYSNLVPEHRRRVSGFKLFADGAFGARSAAVSAPYVDEPNNRGLLLYTDEQLKSLVAGCSRSGKGIAIHAIGDVAIEQVINAIEACSDRGNFTVIRLEHAQLINKTQAQRAKELGIVLSMQPNFNLDSVSYADRLPGEFLSANNPFRMLIDECGFQPGVDLIFGSDGMPHGIDFATRQSFDPPFDSQRLSRQEFVAGYTKSDVLTC